MEPEFNPNDFDASQQSAADSRLLVKFYTKPLKDDGETLAQGRPVFRELTYIDIQVAGDRDGGVCRPATDADKQRFARHFEAFKQRLETPIDGVPLKEWPLMTRTQVEELAFYNIKTVEQLADLNDNLSQQFMGINALKRKAKEFLEAANEGVKVSDLQTQLAERDSQIEALTDRMNAMEANQVTDNKASAGLDVVDEVTPLTEKATKRRPRTRANQKE
jgi:hypothetical protein